MYQVDDKGFLLTVFDSILAYTTDDSAIEKKKLCIPEIILVGQYDLRTNQEVVIRLLVNELICVVINWIKEIGHCTGGFVLIFLRVMDLVMLSVIQNFWRRNRSTPSFRYKLVKNGLLLILCFTV